VYFLKEEIAAINLTKYRKIQHELEESDSRADVAENIVGHLKANTRSIISVNENISVRTIFLTYFIHIVICKFIHHTLFLCILL